MGHDQVQNLILAEAAEHLFSTEANVEEVPLGLYVVRGDNVAIVGEADALNLELRAEPLPEVYQQII